MNLEDAPSLYGISLCVKQLSQEAAQLGQQELADALRDAALKADEAIADERRKVPETPEGGAEK